MKKFFIITLIMLLMMPLFATTYTVMTTRGEQEVVVPEGYSELDVLLILAENYYNLSYEHDDLLKEVETLTSKTEEYVELNKTLRAEYDSLLGKYKTLTEDYKNLSKVNPLKGIIGASTGMSAGENVSFDSLYIHVGVELLEKIDLITTLGYSISSKVLLPSIGVLLTF